MNGGVFDTVYFKTLGHDNVIIEDGSPQAKEFVAYTCKSVVVKFYLSVLFSRIAKNPYTPFVYPKLFRRKQNIQNTHLKDWIEIFNTISKKRISIEKYVYLRVNGKFGTGQRKTEELRTYSKGKMLNTYFSDTYKKEYNNIMETRGHSKNGAKLKSHMSKKHFKKHRKWNRLKFIKFFRY